MGVTPSPERRPGLWSRLAWKLSPNPKHAMFSGSEFFFWMVMAVPSYYVVFLQNNGYNGTQVGLIMALISATSILSQPFWGLISDKIGSVKKTFSLLLVIASIVLTSTVFLGSARLSPGLILGVFLLPLAAFFYAPLNPLLDTWIVDTANREPNISYSKIRLWGSIGYAIVTFSMVTVASRFSANYTFLVFPLFTIPLLAICSRLEDNKAQAKTRVRMRDLHPGQLLRNYYFVFFLLFNMVINSPFSFSGNFLPSLLSSVGGSSNQIGLLNGARALFEIPALLVSYKLYRRFNRPMVLALAAGIHMLTQLLYPNCPNLLTVVIVQFAGGFAGGLAIGTACSYIYQLTPPHLAATAQTLGGALNSLAAIFFNILGGRLFDAFGIRTLFYINAALLFAGATVLIGSYLVGRKILKIPFPDPEREG